MPNPRFDNEAAERGFGESHDSTAYVNWGKVERVRLPNLRPSTTSILLRPQVSLLERIKLAAHKRHVSYQSLIKTWLAEEFDAADSLRR
jgi:predicted DNA binding CopG/RHH family protein